MAHEAARRRLGQVHVRAHPAATAAIHVAFLAQSTAQQQPLAESSAPAAKTRLVRCHYVLHLLLGLGATQSPNQQQSSQQPRALQLRFAASGQLLALGRLGQRLLVQRTFLVIHRQTGQLGLGVMPLTTGHPFILGVSKTPQFVPLYLCLSLSRWKWNPCLFLSCYQLIEQLNLSATDIFLLFASICDKSPQFQQYIYLSIYLSTQQMMNIYLFILKLTLSGLVTHFITTNDSISADAEFFLLSKTSGQALAKNSPFIFSDQ